MNQLLRQHLKNLKAVLLALRATGESGFEGLIGATLCEISGVPFRLAGSGSQFGVDGKPTYEGDVICFEGKRYTETVPRAEVLSKIAELSIKNTEIDIWVLGATSQISSQLADDVRGLGIKNGIIVLILDWSEIDLPPFAVALAMGGARVQEFLKSNISDDKTFRKALEALEAVRDSQDFAPHADRIRAQCNEPAVGYALAQRANTDWLSDAFSSRKRAKVKLGQPLSPRDTNTTTVRERKDLTDKLDPYFTAAPDETLVCILGGEGHGKSWVLAQSWLALAQKPLMIFMGPDNFAGATWRNDVFDFLISELIKQTGDAITEITRKRWRRRISQWQSRPATGSPRLIVVIDGINQRPEFDWARIIESIAYELNQLGGRLIVTARTPYFHHRVKGRLSMQFTEIHVPGWTEHERNEILTEHGIKHSDMHPAVGASLRNPRLLGIALELLDKADITNFEDLSVSRLLFEHMRMSERDAPMPHPAWEFARRLQKDAQKIISRIKAKQQDDLNIFDADIGSVADGRFYHAVDGDPTRYSLKDDGLTLALGFSVIDRLRATKRNGRNLDAELAAILEPIAALDDTAKVVLAALTVTAAEEHYDQEIAAAVIKGFAALQNPDQTQFPAFAGLAKKRPRGFMDSARVLGLAGGRQPNFDWIESALTGAGRDSRAWKEMSSELHLWLSVYSLSLERGTFLHQTDDSQELEEREKSRKKIEEKLHAMSANELAILKNLWKEEGDLSRLSRLALSLLAGKPLAHFAGSLLNWSFSYALNSDRAAPFKDFIHLVSLNPVDWSQTRAAMLEMSAPLRESDVSATGKWTLVNILRATGHSDDGKEAESLVKQLTKDWPHFEGWRRIEGYCATDPCDPASEEPENVTQTAEQYAAIDVSNIRQFMGQTSEDHFFAMARPGLARFKPEIAVAKHREFAADVLSRTGFPLRQGLFELRQHNALLTIKEAHELVKKRHEAETAGLADGLSERDVSIVSEYQLLLAFPFFSAREQAEILLSDEADEGIRLDLLELARPLGEAEFDSLLGTACSENNERNQNLLLALAMYTSVQLSADARTRVAALFRSESERVRAGALGIIAQSGDEELLSQVAESNWNAADTEREDSFEVWYGSMALLKAAAGGLIAHDKALNRISPRLYGRAAAMLDANTVREIARRIDASINHAAGLEADLLAPDIELRVGSSAYDRPGQFSVSERPSETRGIEEVMSRFSESSEAFEKRQRHAHNAFIEFKTNLTRAKARIILNNIDLEDFAPVVETAEDFADRWHRLFMNIDNAKLRAVHNLVLLLAHALGRKAPGKAEELFRRVQDCKPMVRFTFGAAGIQLDAMAIWAGVRTPILDDLRFARLDQVGTDHDLALEVLAALLDSQQELLAAYIETKLRKEEPSEISRGIMVAGFSDQNEVNDEILKRYEGSAGLVGSAYKAAKYAYDRNVWARLWFEKMCQTDENTDFWCYATLFSKVVDGRFSVWHSNYARKGSSIQSFGPSVEDSLKSRFERWKGNRNKKLFGLDAPAPIFLKGAGVNE